MVVTGLEVSRMGSGFKAACRILVILGRSNSKKKTHRNACAAVTKKKKKEKRAKCSWQSIHRMSAFLPFKK